MAAQVAQPPRATPAPPVRMPSNSVPAQQPVRTASTHVPAQQPVRMPSTNVPAPKASPPAIAPQVGPQEVVKVQKPIHPLGRVPFVEAKHPEADKWRKIALQKALNGEPLTKDAQISNLAYASFGLIKDAHKDRRAMLAAMLQDLPTDPRMRLRELDPTQAGRTPVSILLTKTGKSYSFATQDRLYIPEPLDFLVFSVARSSPEDQLVNSSLYFARVKEPKLAFFDTEVKSQDKPAKQRLDSYAGPVQQSISQLLLSIAAALFPDVQDGTLKVSMQIYHLAWLSTSPQQLSM